jgi:cytochrome c peroxidase
MRAVALRSCGPRRILWAVPDALAAQRRITEGFFHNGAVHGLREAIAFYVERDTNPVKWYPRDADGTVRKYDDLPAQYQYNINSESPFGKRASNQPALSASDIDDIVAFLGSLTDADMRGR